MVDGIQLVARGLLAASVLFFAAAHADTTDAGRFTVGRYLDLQTAEDPEISPDGSQIVYLRKSVNRQEDKLQTSVWLVDADGRHHRFLATGSSPVWSPDGKSIAYLAEGQPKGVQIFVLHLSGPGPATQLTSLPQAPANLHWSPDGHRIGFTMDVPDPEKWPVDLPEAPEGAKWAGTPFYTERLHYRKDGAGLTERASRQLFVIAAEGGAPRQVTTGNWRIGETVLEYIDSVNWGFTPDGRFAIVEGFREGDGDRNDQDCNLYAVDLDSGATTRLTTVRGGWREPAVSPDGKTIAYVGFVRNGDSYRVSDLWTMSRDGGNAVLRSAGFDREPRDLAWAPDGSRLYFTAEDRGSVHLYSWSLHGGIQQLTEGAEVISHPSVSAKSIVVARSTFDSPQELQLLSAREPKSSQRLTHLNDELLRGIELAREQELWFDSSGGARVQGWLVKPANFDSSRRYPLLLEIHGGPHAMFDVGFNPSLQNFAANGYLVLYVNPRGSTGYGYQFGNAIAKRYPGVDYDDLMAGVDTVIKQGSVEQSQLFVAGCSGGGVLSSWVIAHTSRFAAAAVRCPVTDWLSMAGETDIPYFTYRFFKKPFWEDPSDWLDESSLMHVGDVKTPTLLMTGELDRRTPIAQTEEFYAALKYRGVPAALLRFDGEYHGTGRKPSNWMRTQLYMLSWFRRFGGNAAGPPPR
ncbi:MAG TPA: S9 family peptidase [Steroidobacteraceae bacterium]|nr:S9 family peptidase [Steroidobacteraceae bacterium]